MTTPPSPDKTLRIGMIALLVITQLLTLASLPIWGVLSFFCGFYKVGILYLWPYPIIGIVSAVFAWRAFRRGSYRTASIVTALPVVIALLFYFLIMRGNVPGVELVCL